MDIVTQGLLGAALAQSISKKTEVRIATYIGLFAGIIADADIFIFSGSDPLLTIEYHRHFTHSVFFIPIGALIAAVLSWYFVKDRIHFKQHYLYCLLGYSLSGFIDACTSYGTYLFWPLYDQRISFNIISIVDPVFTLVLIMAVILAWKKSAVIYARWGLSLCLVYLSLGMLQHQRAISAAQELLAQRSHSVENVVVKPSFANILLWRLVYIADDRIYADAIQLGLKPRIYQGESVALFDVDKALPELNPSSVLYNDIQRFKQFSSGFIALSPDHNNVLGDMRYSMLPNSIKPIWGITINTDAPELHADYRFYRENTPALRQQFGVMLLSGEISSLE